MIGFSETCCGINLFDLFLPDDTSFRAWMKKLIFTVHSVLIIRFRDSMETGENEETEFGGGVVERE